MPAMQQQMKMPEFEAPMPPSVENSTHHNIELSWQKEYERVKSNRKTTDGKIQVCLQEQSRNGGWVTAYNGFAEKGYTIEDLEPATEYRIRLRFKMKEGTTEWSDPLTVYTKKEPWNGENLHRFITLEKNDDVETVLASREVNVNIPDKYGFSPLMVCSQKGYIDLLELLVQYDADVNFQNDAGKTSLMLAAFAGRTQVVKELRYHGADYNISDKGGSTALHWATDGQNCELIEWMIDDGADINVRDLQGWTPLIRTATVTGSREVGKLLVRLGADTNCRDKNGKTALMNAVVNGHLALVDILLDGNADLSVKNEYGKSAYDMAKSMERTGVVHKLEEYMHKAGIGF